MTPTTARGLLFDRDAEVEALHAAVRSAATGSGRLVVIEGVAGQGKSSLLAAARRQAQDEGVSVLAARGSELETDVSFGVAVELFGATLQTAGDPDRSELFRGAAGLAAPLFSGTPADDPLADGPPSSFPVVHGLYWLLANLAEHAPRLVVIDDAHWADGSSLRFLLYLSERLEGLPVTMVVALRPEEAAVEPTALARLRAAPHARVLSLEPLTKDDTVRLIRRLYFPGADDAFCRAVYEVSEGNPFILREVLAVVDLEGIPPTDESADRVRRLAPDSVVRATRARIARLRPEAAALAEAAAVLGNDASVRCTGALAGLDPDVAAAAYADLVVAGILRGGEPLDFAQPPLWSAVYTGLAPARRGALHAGAAALLVDHDPHPERLATHLLHSPPAGDGAVVERLRAAARWALTVGVPETATVYLQRALAEPPPDDRSCAGVLLDLGRLGTMAGDPAAIDQLRRAVELVTDPAAQAEALGEFGRALATNGRYREATAAFHRALQEAGPEPSELRRRLLASQLQATRLAPGSRDHRLLDTARSALAGDDAEDDADDQPTPGRRALLGELAFEWLLAGGRFDEVRAAAHRALAGLELPSDDGPGGLPFYNAVAALTWADDLEVAEESLDRAVAEAQRRGDVTAVATACFRRAVVGYLRGSLAAAVNDAQRAVDASAYGWASYLPAARGILALALTEQGELPRAAAALTPGADGGVGTPTRAIFYQARATLHLVEGNPSDALADALAAGEIMTEGLRSLTPAIVPWRGLAALAHHDLGDRSAARRLAGEAVDLARRFGAPRTLGATLRVSGLVEGGDRGMARLREAVKLLEGSPARLERTRALADLGSALQRRGRPEAAALLREGLELAEACGAVPLANRLREDLAASENRSPRRTRRRATELTPAEERVARLAAGGLTNREVAQQLFVSVRAVEFHLGNLYTKLGISSRRQLAGALEARPAP